MEHAQHELGAPLDCPIIAATISPPGGYELEILATPLQSPDTNAPMIFLQDCWCIAWRVWIRRPGSAMTLELSWQLTEDQRLAMIFGDPDHTTADEIIDLWQQGRRLLEIYTCTTPGPEPAQRP
jgi:hypothetical protein